MLSSLSLTEREYALQLDRMRGRLTVSVFSDLGVAVNSHDDKLLSSSSNPRYPAVFGNHETVLAAISGEFMLMRGWSGVSRVS
jgi:hypothetical protein